MAKVNEAKFRTNEKGELIPLNEEAEVSLRNMTRPRSEALADAGFKGESFGETVSKTSGQDWVDLG